MPPDEQVIRHVVLFGFTPETSASDVDEIVCRFGGLSEQISGIETFEWGLNSSPERLNPELSHCFQLTFHTEATRDAYLIDPAHVAFADWVGRWVQHVTVVDFWVSQSH